MMEEPLRLSFRRHLREEAIRAAHVLTVEKGWDRVRFGEVAGLLGVSRPTLYREFGDKQGLGDALVLAEAERFLVGIANVLDKHSGAVSEAVRAAVQYTLDEAAASPLLKAVLTAPGSDTPRHETGVLPLLTTSAPMLELASERLVTWFGEHFPHIDTDDVADAVDALIRLTISHLVLPTSDSAETRRRISEVALRYLGV
ncbi:TetR/AcrR family transcriptional regulator [Nocardia wallacei]|uniref:TetR/AcrR family transcriptional regulator n=1 Tax=Nocardia wallacei TaxID=480035 RepID=UPI0024578C9A|nr:TetR/AcrR family transcriptional regulator [Nocardia wallacei]